MRKKILFAVSVLICVFTIAFNFINPTAKPEVTAVQKNEKVITVADNVNLKNAALNSRFLNMLNHNFVYDNDFYDTEILVNNSALALLNLAQDGFISESYISDYIFNMYGINITDFASVNTDFEKKDGFVYVVPRGYNICKHRLESVTDNLDGSYTVITNVEISLDDGSVINDNATTVFLKNTDSQFGYNIVYSEIGAKTENLIEC